MTVRTCDVQEFQKYLEHWSGGAVSLNSYHDDHDRLILRLEHPTASEEPVGLSLFYCTYLAGPVRWEQSALTIQTCSRQHGACGFELSDATAGFVVRCASARLYGEPEIVLPEQP